MGRIAQLAIALMVALVMLADDLIAETIFYYCICAMAANPKEK